MSFIQKVPLRRFLRIARPLPGVRGQALVHPSASWSHPASRVPSSWSCTTSTASSAQFALSSLAALSCVESRACCIPLSTMGFAAFRASLPTVQSSPFKKFLLVFRHRLLRAARPSRAEDRSQQRWSHPPKLSPHRQPPLVTLVPPCSRVASSAWFPSVHRLASVLVRFASDATSKLLAPQVPLTVPSTSRITVPPAPPRTLPCSRFLSDRHCEGVASLPLAPGACPDLARHP